MVMHPIRRKKEAAAEDFLAPALLETFYSGYWVKRLRRNDVPTRHKVHKAGISE